MLMVRLSEQSFHSAISSSCPSHFTHSFRFSANFYCVQYDSRSLLGIVYYAINALTNISILFRFLSLIFRNKKTTTKCSLLNVLPPLSSVVECNWNSKLLRRTYPLHVPLPDKQLPALLQSVKFFSLHHKARTYSESFSEFCMNTGIFPPSSQTSAKQWPSKHKIPKSDAVLYTIS